MTDLEKECLEVLCMVRNAWTLGKTTRVGFMELMSRIVQIIKRLEARAGGCPTGTHFGICDCVAAIVGRAQDFKYRKKIA